MIKTLITLFLAIVFLNTSFAQKKQEKLVRKSFDFYKSAILNDQGEDAVNYVDSRTIAYYSSILEQCKSADSLKVSALGPIDKIMVLTIRLRATSEQILSFDGTSLLVFAIKEGMVGKNSVANTTIGDVDVNENFAKGQFISNGQKSQLYFHFYKENELWKIDLTSIFPESSAAIKNMIEQSGQEENAFLLMLLEISTGKTPANSIWHPIL